MSNKFNAKKVNAYGMTFDSKKEYIRYEQLLAQEKAGLITDLQCQVKYPLIPKQRNSAGKLFRECSYVADFVYTDGVGAVIVEDVKGLRSGAAYEVFKLKKKMMLWLYKIEVVEI